MEDIAPRIAALDNELAALETLDVARLRLLYLTAKNCWSSLDDMLNAIHGETLQSYSWCGKPVTHMTLEEIAGAIEVLERINEKATSTDNPT